MNPLDMLKSFRKFVRKNVLLVFLLLGILLGFLLGVLLNGTVQQSTESRKLAMFIGFPGELFLRMLKLVLLPFVVSSVITSLTMIDKNTAGKLGKRAAVYFVVTTLIATTLSTVIGAVIIKPQAQGFEEETKSKTGSSAIYAMLDMLRNMVPNNMVEASISSTGTKLEKRVTDFKMVNKSSLFLKSSARNLSSFLKKEMINPWTVSLTDSVQVIKEKNTIYEYAGQEKYNSPNLLGTLVLSILVGIILNGLDEKGKPIADLFTCLFNLLMEIVQMIIWFSPIGVGSLIASKLAAMENIKGAAENLGLFVIAVTVASIIFGAVILTIIFVILSRRNPLPLLKCVTRAMLTGFGACSSGAVIPLTLSSLKKNKMVDDRLAQFMLPIGTVLNAPGTGMAIAVSAVFIVQTFHPNLLNLTSIIIISISTTLATLAAPPFAGSVSITVQAIVLQVIGIPEADIGLLFAIDWLTDRIVTPVNVWANCTALVIIEHYSHDELQSLDDAANSHDVACTAVNASTDTVVIDIADGGERTEKTRDNGKHHSHDELQSLEDAAKSYDVACTALDAGTNNVGTDIADEEEETAAETRDDEKHIVSKA